MRRAVAVIGERERVCAFALAGVRVLVAEGAGEALAAWRGLGADVGVVILTPAAHQALAREERAERLQVVMPG